MGWDKIGSHAGALEKLRITIVLEEPATISGKVVNHRYKPMAGVHVKGVIESGYMRRL